MLLENRKIQVIEEVLKVNERTLTELESVLKKNRKKKTKPSPTRKISDFTGVMSKADAIQIKKAIRDSCEKIDFNEWH